ncbi:MAG: phosphoenolpyruvate carboxylase, partial [Candidatus Veblenbacteria bacterium]|nr:phosphoenolpyruvate carboxylase [Candidatus Veblenbacteria bacterium]
PFRGGLTPFTVPQFATQYAGVHTVTIQSAFRYDFPLPRVRAALQELVRLLPKTKAMPIASADRPHLDRIVDKASRAYVSSLAPLLPLLAPAFAAVPSRRERRLHVGLLSYSRQLGKKALPRAITFAAACYSLGLPPEFIGLGRALQSFSPAELVTLERYYGNLHRDISCAARFYCRESVSMLARRCAPLKRLVREIEYAARLLNITLGPRTVVEQEHAILARRVAASLKHPHQLSRLIAQGGVLRHSLG